MYRKPIYCDFDGVFDIETKINQTQDNDDFEFLSPVNNNLQFWINIRGYKPIILIIDPISDKIIDEKINWCNNNLGENYLLINNTSERTECPDYDYYILVTTSEKKATLATYLKDSILIDNKLTSYNNWEDAGGFFIHFDKNKLNNVLILIKMITE